MDQRTETQPWKDLRSLATADDTDGLRALIDTLSPSEALRAIFRLDPADRQLVLTTLSPEEAADLIDEMPDEHAADLIEQLPVEDAAAILNEMDSDDQADVLGEMKSEDADAILAEMAPEEAKDARRLMKYEDDEVGGLMMTEVFAYEEDVTVADVLEGLSAAGEISDQPQIRDIYVISRWKRLIGVVRLSEIVMARRTMVIADLVRPSSFVTPATKLDELEQLFSRSDAYTFPVINPHARVIGVVTRDALTEALNERAEEEYRKLQGIVGGDEIRTMPLLTRARRRLSWLSINIVLNVIAASVIAYYESTLSAVIALAVFLPIISDMSGCSGNQAVAVSMRELSLGLVKPYEAFRV